MLCAEYRTTMNMGKVGPIVLLILFVVLPFTLVLGETSTPAEREWTKEQRRAYEEAYVIFNGSKILGGSKSKSINPASLLGSGVETWEILSPDGWNLHGWSFRKEGSPGTVLIVHGFMESSQSAHAVVEPAEFLVKQLGYSVAALDLRFHGKSGNGIPTFGPYEASDIHVAFDHLEQSGYPKPYYLLGTSLGAMASAHAVFQDARIKGAFLVMPPASAQIAISKEISYVPTWGTKILSIFLKRASTPENWINETYGTDIISQADLAKLTPTPGHHPKLLVVMATDDPYGYKQTQKAWEVWYPGEKAELNRSPAQEPKQFKWLIGLDPKNEVHNPDALIRAPNGFLMGTVSSNPNACLGHGLSPLWPPFNQRLLVEFLENCQALTRP